MEKSENQTNALTEDKLTKLRKYFYGLGILAFIFIIAGYVLSFLGGEYKSTIQLIVSSAMLYTIAVLCALRVNGFLGIKKHRWIGRIVVLIILMAVLFGIGKIIGGGVETIKENIPVYKENITKVLDAEKIANILNKKPTTVEGWLDMSRFAQWIPVNSILKGAAKSFASITSNFMAIMFYMLFIFLSDEVIRKKYKTGTNIKITGPIFDNIIKKLQLYLGIKTLISLCTAVSHALLFWLCGLELMLFWSLIVFMLNYIPSIGSLIAVLLVAVGTFAQLGFGITWLGVVGGCIVIQAVWGNGVEPQLTGSKLNILPIILVLSLVFMGIFWGPLGAVLSVIFISSTETVLREFPATRKIAFVLSGEGDWEVFENDCLGNNIKVANKGIGARLAKNLLRKSEAKSQSS